MVLPFNKTTGSLHFCLDFFWFFFTFHLENSLYSSRDRPQTSWFIHEFYVLWILCKEMARRRRPVSVWGVDGEHLAHPVAKWAVRLLLKKWFEMTLPLCYGWRRRHTLGVGVAVAKKKNVEVKLRIIQWYYLRVCSEWLSTIRCYGHKAASISRCVSVN